MTRDAKIDEFLARLGFARARRSPLAQDASFRRYLRLTDSPAPAVLMDAPPPEDVRPFVRIARHLAGIGLSVPVVMGVDEANGLLLEEDLGDDLISGYLDAPRSGPATPETDAHLHALFDGAVDALVAMQRSAPPPDLPPWDAAAMTQTAVGNLIDWWWPAAMGRPAPEAAKTDFTTALTTMLEPLPKGPLGFVHRDYFAGNLLHLPFRPGIRAIGIIDFQSAAIGHPAYDLVSLLQDARRDIPPSIEARALTRYLNARPELEPGAFRAGYAACAAQRHLRVACQWVRLAKRDNRPHYLVHGPRTWRLLTAALTQPQAKPLMQAFDRWIPMDLRRNPPGFAA